MTTSSTGRLAATPSAGHLKDFCAHYEAVPHNYCVALTLEGVIDQRVLNRVMSLLPERHDCLRTFLQEDERGGLERLLAEDVDMPLTRVGMRGLPLANRDEEFRLCWEAETCRMLDDSQAPLAHFSLFELGKWRNILVLCFHPAVAAEPEVAALIDDLGALYHAISAGKVLPEIPQLDVVQKSISMGSATPLWEAGLPNDFEASSGTPLANRSWQHKLPEDTAARLFLLAEETGLPPERILLGVFTGVMSRYTGETEFSMAWLPYIPQNGSPWHNMVRLNIELTHQPSFRDHVTHLHQHIVTGQACAGAVDEEPNVVFSYRKEHSLLDLPQLKMFREPHQAVPAALSLSGVEDGGMLSLLITYDPRRYEHRTVERLCRHLETMLHGCLVFPDQPVNQLPMLTREERLLLRAWQTRGKLHDDVSLVHEVFEQVAVRNPEHPALAHGNRRYSFQELNEMADRFSLFLRGQQLKPGRPVAVVMTPGVDMVVATLAVLKAGAMLFPISPDSSPRRIIRLVRRASVKMVLHNDGLADHLRRVTLLDVPASLHRQIEGELEDPLVTPGDGALLRYPVMGAHIMMEHSTLLAMIQRQSMVSGVGGGEHIIYMNQVESDIWLRDLFGTWKNEGTALLARNQKDQQFAMPFVFQPQY